MKRIGYALYLLSLIAISQNTVMAQDVGLGDGSDGALNYTGSSPINLYTALTTSLPVSSTEIGVANATGFVSGDVILLWQVKTGPFVSGDLQAIDLAASNAGHYELQRITNINGNTISLETGTTHAYVGPGTQVVRVPEYTTVTVAGSEILSPTAWDGTTGGIVAFLATETVTVDGAIDASGLGSRGGQSSESYAAYGYTCAQTCGDDTPTNILDSDCERGITPATCAEGEGRRGEGLDNSDRSYDVINGCGRGNRATGGGGGGHVNAGGGGGGNGGSGGYGGNAWQGGCPAAGESGGLSGTAVTGSLLNYLTFGGGGGGGSQNNSNSGNGGAGGGAIFFRANALNGTGSIRTNGGNGGAASNDGGGGGGAGGSVLIQLVGDAACAGIEANGGTGSDTSAGHGDGAGGGGGRIKIDSDTVSACPTALTGGVGPSGHSFPSGGGDGLSGLQESNDGAFGCTANADCSNPTPYCNQAAHACEPCVAHSGCTEDGLLICDEGSCVECVDDTDCSTGKSCNPSTNLCEPDSNGPTTDAGIGNDGGVDAGNPGSTGGIAGGSGCAIGNTSSTTVFSMWVALVLIALLRRRITRTSSRS